jgi:nucleotide-binding universal stress UspA family protein
MTIGFIAISVLLPRAPAASQDQRVSLLDPLRALRHRATRGSGLTAAFYNFGFFTLLAYTPFVLHLGVHQLGYTFTGWGLMLAIFAVFVAPRFGRRFGDVRGLGLAMVAITAVLLAMGVLNASQTALIACVIVSGAFLGITNTLMTQVVMESAPVARPIASSAYSFVRFCGGAIAPFVAGKLAEHISAQSPFYLGAAMMAIGVGILFFYRRSLVPARETAPAGQLVAAAPPAPRPGVLLVAVAGSNAHATSALAVPLARARGGEVHILHVVEEDILAGEDAIELESDSEATELLEACIAELRQSGMPVTGELLHSLGTHADVAERILRRAGELEAGALGRPLDVLAA